MVFGAFIDKTLFVYIETFGLLEEEFKEYVGGNLKDFTVDINNSVRLRELVPENILFVSESGMKTRQDIARLEQNGTNAVLIGETLMRSADKKAVLRELRRQVIERS